MFLQNYKIRFLTIFYLFVFAFFPMSIAFAKETVVIHAIKYGKNLSFSSAYKDELNQQLPYYVYQKQFNGNEFDVQVSNLNYINVDIEYSDSWNISTELLISKQLVKEKGKNKANIIINPYRLNGQQLQLLQSFDINIIATDDNSNLRPSSTLQSYVSNSVLANGDWYKFGVSKAGIYKLDFNFFKQLGMNTGNIHPNNIRIFGQFGGMLPELAGADRVDDLKEYPIKVITQNPNQFQQGDFVLVYCKGPDLWNYDGTKQQFKFTKNLYSATQNLFITTNNGSGLRIGSISGNTLSENFATSTYDALDFIEQETENLGMSGRTFVGDRFINQTSKVYQFNFPNIISNQPLKIWTNVVAVANSFSTMNISMNSNSRNISMSPLQQEYPAVYSYGMTTEQSFLFNNPSSNVQLNYQYQSNDFSAKAYLDFINVQAKCNLVYDGTPLYFREQQTVGSGRITKFTLSNANANVEVWDITNPFDVKKINYTLYGNKAIFTIETDILKEFVAYENTTSTPTAYGKIANQNLHALEQQDYIIVTRKGFISYAEELAQLHRTQENLKTIVVDVEQIFNEFSSGANDITAIRNFVKMFYDRAINDADKPKYLLLFGDGSYDNKNYGDFLLPTYQSKSSFSALNSYTSDDYFGILDDTEGDNIENTTTNLIDIGVGRIPADNTTKAQHFVDKVKHYYSQNAFGDWRSQITFIADDEDNNLHIDQAEIIAKTTTTQLTKYNVDKIYLDAFQQQHTINGSTYPDANMTLNNKIYNGTLLVNYIGHGGGTGLTQEKLVTLTEIDSWNNENKLPIFITATCEFARFDESESFSAGERLLLKEKGGAVGLLTTTRLVFANENFDINKSFMTQFTQSVNQQDLLLGDILKLAKRQTFTGDGNRKFLLLGDPALRLAFPKNNVVLTEINEQTTDTLKALKKIVLKGEVRDNTNQIISNFNGVASIIVYDKKTTENTLANDPTSQQKSFEIQKNKIYKGKATVNNGAFQVAFIVPKDINYQYGKAKISVYANSTNSDALGADTNNVIGGIDTTVIIDNKGPIVEAFMNDEHFVFGGITNEAPILLLKLFDDNGINTSGNGVGHDITAILDNNTKDIKILNDFYESEIDNLQKGTVKFPLDKISHGRHTLHAKAWDIMNNSGEAYTEFVVEKSAKLAISHVLNYPNPFTTKTKFMFEHNKPNQNLDLKIEIFAVSGKLIKSIQQNINTSGFRVADIEWDGRDDFGDKIGKGVYIYKITLKDENGGKISQYQKLVILN